MLPGLGNQEQFNFHTDAIKKGTGRYSFHWVLTKGGTLRRRNCSLLVQGLGFLSFKLCTVDSPVPTLSPTTDHIHSVVFALQAHAACCPFGSPGGSLPHREGHTKHAEMAGAGCLRESPQKMRIRQEFTVDHKEGRP